MTGLYSPVLEFAAAAREYVQIDRHAFSRGDMSIRPFPLHHPQGAWGYRIETNGAAIVHASDVEHGDATLDAVLREYAGRGRADLRRAYTEEERSNAGGATAPGSKRRASPATPGSSSLCCFITTHCTTMRPCTASSTGPDATLSQPTQPGRERPSRFESFLPAAEGHRGRDCVGRLVRARQNDVGRLLAHHVDRRQDEVAGDPGKIEASTTRRFLVPCTRKLLSTTAMRSDAGPSCWCTTRDGPMPRCG